VQDFAEVLSRPRLVMLGAGLQYTIMPLMGLSVSRLAGLAAPLAIG
jgi:bile acid:Na+ symporter, BASS family